MEKKTKKKNKKRSLGSLLLLLFLTIVFLSTATYAWFTSNRTVTIADIDVNVATSSGLQISSDGSNWKTILSNEDLIAGYSVTDSGTSTTVTDKNMILGSMVPVSTIGSISNGYMQMYKGTVMANETTGVFELTAAVSPEAKSTTTGDFIAFDVFLKTEQAETVYLQVGSGVTATDAASATKGLQYASRIALIKGANIVSTASQYQIVNLAGGTTPIIIEPNYDGHTQYGITQGGAYYTDYTYADGAYTNLTAGVDNGYVTWDGVSQAIATGIPLENTNATDNSTYFRGVTPTIRTNAAFSDGTGSNVEAFALSAGVTKMRIYMWIEGQDIDCENNASGSNLTFNLSFTLDA